MRRLIAVVCGVLAVLAAVALAAGAYLGAQVGFFVITGLVVLGAGRAAQRLWRPAAVARPADVAPGAGDYIPEPISIEDEIEMLGAFVSVVPDPRYQQVLASLAGPSSVRGVYLSCRALIVAEPDNPYDAAALRVEIAGKRVGYVEPDDSRAVAELLRRKGDGGRLEVGAEIVTGDLVGHQDLRYGLELRLDED